MAYTTVEGRQELLDTLATAADDLGGAVASLVEAYEQLDEGAADRLESELFRPVQVAYGRAKRAHTEFASRYELESRAFEAQAPGPSSQAAKDRIERAVGLISAADAELSELQDSMLPIEVGDEELRAALTDLRSQIAGLPHAARELVRILGR